MSCLIFTLPKIIAVRIVSKISSLKQDTKQSLIVKCSLYSNKEQSNVLTFYNLELKSVASDLEIAAGFLVHVVEDFLK